MTGHRPQPDLSPEAQIRDAACVIVVDSTNGEPELLMGRRHADQVFLPDKWVFPGGRVDAGDRTFAASFDCKYTPHDLAAEIRPFALAAVRELCEETGLVIGSDKAALAHLAEGWSAFAATGCTPVPAHLYPLARAITPPGRARRYDTWFFVAERNAVASTQTRPDGELLDLDWFPLGKARKLDLPNITRLILEDVASRLQDAARTGDFAGEQLPFYYADACGFQRTLISCTGAPTTP
jgi:8-oxo-dGTP pyrophosphatase MutT (NUDIX family)